jgi:L-ascorbate metabolism protein UlaG (beta-lactamase superfamily)
MSLARWYKVIYFDISEEPFMKSLFKSIAIVFCSITIVQAQISFVNNGQQLNNLAGRGVARAKVLLNTTKNLVDITYVANEGFLISGATGRILIDGIFTEGYGRYPVPTGEVLSKLRNATSPFDHLTAMLITHNHADHINPFYTVQHLQNDSMCTLIGSPQVNTLLKTTIGYNQISNRVIEIPAGNSLVDTSIQNTTFKIVPLPHSDNPTKDIQNRGFILNIGGFKIFHCGDAASTNLQDYQKLNLSDEKIDIVFLPTWFFDNGSGNKGREIINYLAPKAIVMMHIESSRINYYQNLIKTMTGIPPVYIFKSSLQVLSLSDSSLVTKVQDRKSESPFPDDFKLSNNFPNPFNPSTTIQYSLFTPSHVILTIHNILGQRIRTLSDSFQNIGGYSLVWDAKDDQNKPVGSGIYFYTLGTRDQSIQKKMLLIR